MSTTSLLDRIKSKRQALAAKTNRERAVKLGSGKNLIRILPRWDGTDGVNYHDFGQHFIKDEAGTVKAVYICTANTFGKDCEVCVAMADAATAVDPNNTAAMKILAEAKGSNRVLVNALYYNGAHPDPKNSPVLLELPPSTFDQVLAIAEDYAQNHEIDVFSLDGGYNLTIEKTGTGRDTEYKVIASPKPTAIDPKVLEKAKNIDDFVKQEYDQGLQNALTSLRSNVKVSAPRLSGPSSTPSKPAPTPSQRLQETAPVDFDDDVIEGEATVITSPVGQAVDEIDALLAELDNAA